MDSLFSKRNLPLVILNISTILIVAVILMVNQVLANPDQTTTTETFSAGVLSYQGTLMDSLGNPVTGSYEITFRIYNSPTSTTPLWEEARSGANAVPVQSGLFNVMLGSLNPIPETVWEQTELFLGVKIGSDAEMSPREKLTFVPAAASSSVAQLALTVPDGSIGAVQIADGAINSSEVKLTHGEVYGSGEVLLLTAIPQIVPSMTFTVNPPTNQVIQVHLTLDSYRTLDCVTLIASIYIDNSPIGPGITLGTASNPERTTLSTVRQAPISAGSHTITIKAFCEAGSGGSIWTGQSSLSYILFSQ